MWGGGGGGPAAGVSYVTRKFDDLSLGPMWGGGGGASPALYTLLIIPWFRLCIEKFAVFYILTEMVPLQR